MAVSNQSSRGLSDLDTQALSFLMALQGNTNIEPEIRELFNRTIKEQLNPSFSGHFKDLGEVTQLTIDTSGKDGDDGHPAIATQALGIKGMNGGDGEDGHPARDIHLRLRKKGEYVEVEWDDGKALLKLGESTSRIAIRAIGGRGGRGGLGGRGGKGIQGRKGQNATAYSGGEDGHKGGTGGSGGDGGCGGIGGRGGHLTVTVSPEESDLLRVLKQPNLSGGDPGEGGSGGLGGAGGPGGKGGESYQWTETMLTYQANFSAGGRLDPRTVIISKTNQEGSEGSYGAMGCVGSKGSQGKHGTDGKIEIRIGENVYYSLHGLA